MSRHHQDTVTVGVGALSIEEVVAVARFGAQVEISAEALAEINQLPGIHITRSAENNFEIMPEGVNKGLALQELTQVMGITMDEVMAIGDSDNDSDMLRIAGMPVVMGNGDEAVKKLAKYVTDTNDNDGVAKAIYKFI